MTTKRLTLALMLAGCLCLFLGFLAALKWTIPRLFPSLINGGPLASHSMPFPSLIGVISVFLILLGTFLAFYAIHLAWLKTKKVEKDNSFLELLQHITVTSADTKSAGEAFQLCIDEICQYLDWPIGHAYLLADDKEHTLIPTRLWFLSEPQKFKAFQEATEITACLPKVGVPGKVFAADGPIWIEDLQKESPLPQAKITQDLPIRAAFAFPVRINDKIVGVIECFHHIPRRQDPYLLRHIEAIGRQLGRDIERKRIHRALGTLRNQYEQILNCAGDGIYCLDPLGKISFVNPSAAEMLGYEIEELLCESEHQLLHHTTSEGNPYPESDCKIRTALCDGEVHTVYHEVFWRKDQTSIPVEYTSTPIRDETGKPVGAVVVFKNVSERREAQEKLDQYMEDLLRSNQELDEFAYVASHDLKEPLRGIHNQSKFLLEDYEKILDQEGVKKLNRLAYLSKQMENLINDLLHFSRLGRAELAIKSTDLNLVIEEIRQMLEPLLEENNVSIEIPRRLPTVKCDQTRTKELFRNLITNAIKYNDKPEKHVEIGFFPKYRDDQRRLKNVFYVKDNGIGIKPEFHEAIFRIFKRLHKKDAYGGGTGAGLTFVRKIIERFGGKLWLQSEPDVGSTFFFTLSGKP